RHSCRPDQRLRKGLLRAARRCGRLLRHPAPRRDDCALRRRLGLRARGVDDRLSAFLARERSAHADRSARLLARDARRPPAPVPRRGWRGLHLPRRGALARAPAAMCVLLTVHLGFVLGLFLTLPYGKFVHSVYRFAALLRDAIEKARAA